MRPDCRTFLMLAINGYIVDLTDFAAHHPGTKARILDKRAKNFDISRNFLDHFGHTVKTFCVATQEFEGNGDNRPATFTFKERPNALVRIIGWIK